MSARNHRVILSAEARADLSDLLLYTERQWGVAQRREYRQSLSKAFADLATFPNVGRSRPDLGPEYLSIRIRQHVIVYRVVDREIRIDRLLHVRRDAGAEFENESD